MYEQTTIEREAQVCEYPNEPGSAADPGSPEFGQAAGTGAGTPDSGTDDCGQQTAGAALNKFVTKVP